MPYVLLGAVVMGVLAVLYLVGFKRVKKQQKSGSGRDVFLAPLYSNE